MILRDIAEMPGFNLAASSRGDRSVSEGKVYWDPQNKVCCHRHRAMLCVSPDRKLWRCIACGVGAYLPEPLAKTKERRQP